MSLLTTPGARLAAVLVTAGLAQYAVIGNIRLLGTAPDVLLAMAVAAGLVAGPRLGAITGFFAGLAMDLVMAGRPLGVAVLTYTLIGYLVGRYRTATAFESVVGDGVVAAVAGALSVVGYMLVARLLAGTEVLGGRWPVVSLVVALWTVVLVVPARPVARWVWASEARVWAR